MYMREIDHSRVSSLLLCSKAFTYIELFPEWNCTVWDFKAKSEACSDGIRCLFSRCKDCGSNDTTSCFMSTILAEEWWDSHSSCRHFHYCLGLRLDSVPTTSPTGYPKNDRWKLLVGSHEFGGTNWRGGGKHREGYRVKGLISDS